MKRSLHFGYLLDVHLWLPIAWELLNFYFVKIRPFNSLYGPLEDRFESAFAEAFLKGFFWISVWGGFFLIFMAKLWGEKCDGVNYLRNVEEYFIWWDVLWNNLVFYGIVLTPILRISAKMNPFIFLSLFIHFEFHWGSFFTGIILFL